MKAFNTVKEDLDEEEEYKENEDEIINKRRRDYTLKDNIELCEEDFDHNAAAESKKKSSKEHEADMHDSQEEDVLNSYHIRKNFLGEINTPRGGGAMAGMHL